MNVSIQAMRGSAENTFFPYVDWMYRILFKELESKLGWKIYLNSRPCVKEQFGNPHGQHHTVLRIEGCKPIVIDEREVSYITPAINDFDAWFIVKYAYREKEGFYNKIGVGIENDIQSKSLGGCRHKVVPWAGHAWEYGRWKTKPCEAWISNFDKDINLIFTGTDRRNRDTGILRSSICRTIEKYLPPMSYLGLHTVPFSITNGIDNVYSNIIIKSLYEDYQNKLSRTRIGLSLPGLGLACYREYEYFAQCIPCIAPKFEVRYADPLIPDYHYVAFDLEKPESFKEAYDKLQSKDFYDFISFNAWNWWQKNSNPKNKQGMLDSFLSALGQCDSFREKFPNYYSIGFGNEKKQ
jgi:hypothetical protein